VVSLQYNECAQNETCYTDNMQNGTKITNEYVKNVTMLMQSICGMILSSMLRTVIASTMVCKIIKQKDETTLYCM
jgi:hypothetical protein